MIYLYHFMIYLYIYDANAIIYNLKEYNSAVVRDHGHQDVANIASALVA